MREESWHLSKAVPVSLIVTLIVQAGAFIWLIRGMDSQITHNKEDIIALEREVDLHTLKQSSVDVKLGRIEENIKSIGNSLSRIEEKLDGTP